MKNTYIDERPIKPSKNQKYEVEEDIYEQLEDEDEELEDFDGKPVEKKQRVAEDWERGFLHRWMFWY